MEQIDLKPAELVKFVFSRLIEQPFRNFPGEFMGSRGKSTGREKNKAARLDFESLRKKPQLDSQL